MKQIINRTLTKSCLAILSGSVCFCLPQMASAHSSILNNDAWQVCQSSKRSNSCEYADNHENIYRGTCQLMSEKLLCVRNQPIVKADPDSTH